MQTHVTYSQPTFRNTTLYTQGHIRILSNHALSYVFTCNHTPHIDAENQIFTLRTHAHRHICSHVAYMRNVERHTYARSIHNARRNTNTHTKHARVTNTRRNRYINTPAYTRATNTRSIHARSTHTGTHACVRGVYMLNQPTYTQKHTQTLGAYMFLFVLFFLQ